MVHGRTTLVTVVARDGNRRDAVISCGACGRNFVPMHFYEAPGEPLLDGAMLWIFHYAHYPAVSEHNRPITVRLAWDDGRAAEVFRFTPETRALERITA